MITLPKSFFNYYLRPLFLFWIIPKYLCIVFAHKLYILLFGLLINFKLRRSSYRIPLHRLIFHDWSKLQPIELFCYADKFFGEKNAETDAGFSMAFHHHVLRPGGLSAGVVER